jgi:hypothetical protein
MYVITPDGILAYAGAIDDKPSPSGPIGDVNYVRNALEQCLSGKPVEVGETRSYGCSVKYAS